MANLSSTNHLFCLRRAQYQYIHLCVIVLCNLLKVFKPKKETNTFEYDNPRRQL